MLDDRKLKVLYAIINSYLIAAEPIGSRTLSKEHDLGVSSATIRNEMSDLEDLGYLNKPHTSAGRIPSDKAYRLYVNQLLASGLNKDALSKKHNIKKSLIRESKEIDQLIQNSAKMLSAITSYTALALSPQLKESKLKHIQLLPIDHREILLLIVSDSGIVKNTIFRVDEEVPGGQLTIISNYLNDKLRGLTIDEITIAMGQNILKDMYKFKEIIENIIPIVTKSLEEGDASDVYADGVTRIFDFPEYKDLEKAKSFISFMEDKDLLVEILRDSQPNGIEITIGDENIYDPLKECSLITTTYKLGNITIGKIGVIGPTRMDYSRVIGVMKLFSHNLSEVLDILLSE